MYKISDITPQLKIASSLVTRHSSLVTIVPVTITASRRDYPSVIENRGKGFALVTRHSSLGTIYTARHVISDSGYNYFIDGSTPLTSLYYLSGDLGSAIYSGMIDQGSKFVYNTGINNNQILMGQYRNNDRSWLTGTIVSSGDEGIIIDLPVLPGDSGSPVIFSDQTLGIVSQSHRGNQAIVQKILKG